MFPGYVTLFKDNNELHLYFYPGIDDNEDKIYRDLDLSKCTADYKEIIHSDGATEYIFSNPKIIKIICTLVGIHGKVDIQELKI